MSRLYPGVIDPQLAPQRASPGGVAVPLGLGARRWWSADQGHDQSATIAAWRDVVAGDVLAAAGAARPSYNATGCGNRPAIDFDGVGEYLSIAGSSAYDLGAACTIYAVFAASGTASNASVCARYSTVAADALWWLQYHAGADTNDGAFAISETGTNTTRFAATATSVDLSIGTAVDLFGTWSGTEVGLVALGTAATPAACAGAKTQNATPLEVGRIALASPVYATMSLRHLMFFARTLTAGERTALRAWAAADCGVP